MRNFELQHSRFTAALCRSASFLLFIIGLVILNPADGISSDADSTIGFESGSHLSDVRAIPKLFIPTDDSMVQLYLDEEVGQLEVFKSSIDDLGSGLHIVSHGKSGSLQVDGKWLDAQELVTWIDGEYDLGAIEHLYIYGCEFAKGAKGRAAVDLLSTKLNIPVSASDDLTGSDGDWDLEVQTQKANGSIKASQYNGNLEAKLTKIDLHSTALSCGETAKLDIVLEQYNGSLDFDLEVHTTIPVSIVQFGDQGNYFSSISYLIVSDNRVRIWGALRSYHATGIARLDFRPVSGGCETMSAWTDHIDFETGAQVDVAAIWSCTNCDSNAYFEAMIEKLEFHPTQYSCGETARMDVVIKQNNGGLEFDFDLEFSQAINVVQFVEQGDPFSSFNYEVSIDKKKIRVWGVLRSSSGNGSACLDIKTISGGCETVSSWASGIGGHTAQGGDVTATWSCSNCTSVSYPEAILEKILFHGTELSCGETARMDVTIKQDNGGLNFDFDLEFSQAIDVVQFLEQGDPFSSFNYEVSTDKRKIRVWGELRSGNGNGTACLDIKTISGGCETVSSWASGIGGNTAQGSDITATWSCTDCNSNSYSEAIIEKILFHGTELSCGETARMDVTIKQDNGGLNFDFDLEFSQAIDVVQFLEQGDPFSSFNYLVSSDKKKIRVWGALRSTNSNGTACLDIKTISGGCETVSSWASGIGGNTAQGSDITATWSCTDCSGDCKTYKVSSVTPECPTLSGYSGVIFENVSNGYETWQAGSDLIYTKYDNGNAKLSGTIIKGSTTGTINIDYTYHSQTSNPNINDCFHGAVEGIQTLYNWSGTLVTGGQVIQLSSIANVQANEGMGASAESNQYGLMSWGYLGDVSRDMEIIFGLDKDCSNPPTTCDITCPNDITITCDGDINNLSITGQATSNCPSGTSITYADVVISQSCPQVIQRTWTATYYAQVYTCTQNITVNDTEAPVAPNAPRGATYQCADDVPNAETLTATDNCSGSIQGVVSETTAPGDCANSFVLTRTWTFADACGNESSVSQTINVIDTETPVAPNAPIAATYECADDVPSAETLTAIDNCSGAVQGVVSETTVEGGCANTFILTRTWTFTDACGNESSVSQTINVVDLQAPVAPNAPRAVTYECVDDVPNAETLTAFDNCSGAVQGVVSESITQGECANRYVLVRQWIFADACNNQSSVSQTINVIDLKAPVATNVPGAATYQCADDIPNAGTVTAIDNCSGVVQGVLSETTSRGNCANSFVLTRTWTFTDECGNDSSESQTITVEDTEAPVATNAPSAATYQCADDIPNAQTLTANDNCSGVVQGVVSETTSPGDCANGFVLTRTWTFTDECGNESSVSQTINVVDRDAPVAPNAPGAATYQCADDIPNAQTLTANDNCSGVIQGVVSETTLPGDCANSFVLTRTWTFTDACDNESSVSQLITVNDTEAPELTGTRLPVDVTIDCATAVPAAPSSLTGVDNCDGLITGVLVETREDGDCANSFVVTRTWTFTDDCDNSSQHVQVITVADLTPPTVVCKDIVLQVGQSCEITITPEDINDGSFDSCSEIASMELDKTTFDCSDNLGNNTVTLTVTDACGNTSTCTANVRIEKFDLALRTIISPNEDDDRFYAGETVTFKVEVHNQGTLAASNVDIINYIPNGLTLQDNDWTRSGSNALYTFPGTIAPGQMEMVEITFLIEDDASAQLINRAEIADASAPAGFSDEDVDSTPNQIQGDDSGGEVNSSNDDEINEGCCSIDGDDEDDSDPEDIFVERFDLALRKTASPGEPAFYYQGQTASFQITVFNQGTVPASNIVISDPAVAGLDLVGSVPSIPGPIAPGGNATVDVQYIVSVDETGTLTNRAEIASAEDDMGNNPEDIDSTPDTNPSNDTEKDDVINEDGKNNPRDDEDDADLAVINTQALGSISGNVSEDIDNDDDGDNPIAGVTITLTNNDTGETMTTVTDANGNYIFEGLQAGEYTITEQDESEIDEDYVDVFDGDETPEDADDAVDNLKDDSIEVTLGAGEDDDDNNFVEEQLGTINGTVSLDDDNDGTADSPQAGVTVTLTDLDSGETVTTVTDGNGNYSFEGLEPGDYTVTVGTPDNAQSISDKDEDPDGDASDTDETVDDSVTVTLSPGEDDNENNFVDILLGSIWGSVTADTNNDDQGDEGLGGIIINLVDDNGDVVATTTTANDGTYEFEDVLPGDYTVVQVSSPTGNYQDVSDKDESINANDLDGDDGNTPNNQIPVTVNPGEADADNDFVEEELGSIWGSVTADVDNDDTGDEPLGGIIINLVDDNGDVVATTTTANDGTYEFEDVEPGDYTVVQATEPTGSYQDVSDKDESINANDPDGDDGNTPNDQIPVTVDAGEADADNDFVEEELGSIWGSVTADTNNDDTGDEPLGGIIINLVDDNGDVVATTTTANDGTYEFEDVEPGDYTVVQATEPTGSYQDVSDKDESINANDPDGDDGNTPNDQIPVTVDAGEADADNDFVEEELGSIWGSVTADVDNDDTGDEPLGGIIINLVDDNGDVVATTTTANDGTYEFEDVEPGDYTVVQATEPTGNYQDVSDKDESINANDPDGDDGNTPNDQIPVTVDAGEADADNDFVEEELGSIWGSVTADVDNDDTGDEPLGGIIINLVDDNGDVVATTTTANDGTYEFEDVEPGDYTVVQATEPTGSYQDVSDKDESINANDPDGDDGNTPNDQIPVTVDAGEADADNDFVEEELGSIWGSVTADVDNDDTGDEPLGGIIINLVDDNGDVVATTTTANDGTYEFEDVEPGDYTVVQATEPTGNYQDVSDKDESINANDPDGDDGNTPNDQIPVTVDAGEADADNDFVEEELGAITGEVFTDSNGNGIQDPGEEPIAGVQVQLKDAAGNIVQTVVTDANGVYDFVNLSPGTYSVVFDLEDPANSQFAPANQGGNEAIDSDAVPAMGGMTEPFEVVSGEIYEDADAGIMYLASVCVNTFKSCLDGSLLGNEYVTVNYSYSFTNGIGDVQQGTGTFESGDRCLEFYPGVLELNVSLPTSPTGLTYAEAGSDANNSGDINDITVASGSSNDVTVLYADITAPTFGTIPNNATYECDDVVYPATPDAFDNCDNNVEISRDSTVRLEGCLQTITYTWTATDDCDNSTEVSATITIDDTTAPTSANQPQPITVECGDAIPTFTPQWSDNCSANAQLVVTVTSETTASGCNEIETFTYRAEDACGNVSTMTRVVTIVDTTDPVFGTVPNGGSYECDDVVYPATPQASDICDNNVEVTRDSTVRLEGCLQTITYTWTATDDCDNSTQVSATITIDDTTAPTSANQPQPITVECGDAIPTFTPQWSDNCSANAQLVVTVTSETTASGCNEIETFTYRAEDACGNVSTMTRVVTIVDTTDPVFGTVPNGGSYECDDVVYPATPQASDICDNNVEVTRDSTVRLEGCLQTITYTWTATDDCDNSTQVSATITIDDTTAPTSANQPQPITVECGDAIPTFTPQWSDNCSANASLVVTVSSETTTSGCNEVETFTYRAEDACGNVSTMTRVVTIVDTTDPVFGTVPNGGAFECDYVLYPVTPQASDICDNNVEVTRDSTVRLEGCLQTITYTWTATDDCDNSTQVSATITIDDTKAPTSANQPQPITVECGDAIPTFTPQWSDNCSANAQLVSTVSSETTTSGCNEIETFTYRAEDACGNVSTMTRVVTIVDTTDPVFGTVPNGGSYECDDVVYPATPQASDICDNNVEVTRDSTVRLEGCLQTITYTWTATDDCDNSTQVSATITIDDTTAPTSANQPQPITVECGDAIPTFTPQWSDNCSANAQLVATVSSETTTSGCNEVETFTYRAEDACGNVSTMTRVVTIVDTTDPVFGTVPNGGAFECDYVLYPANPRASDICDNNVEVTRDSTVRLEGCLQTITYTWTATDDCDNSTQASATITINDTKGPIANNPPVDEMIACGGEVPAYDPQWSDNCTAAADLVVSIVPSDGSEGCEDIKLYVYTATDACGNSSSVTRRVRIVDNEDPVFDGLIPDQTASCFENVAFGTPTFSDNCGTPTLTFVDNTTRGNCANEYTVTRTWTITDLCGNTATTSANIEYVDTEGPSILNVPSNATYECDYIIYPATPTAFDLCSGDVKVSRDSTISYSINCPENYSILYIWSASDECNDLVTAQTLINVVDTKAPVLSEVVEEIVVNLSAGESMPSAPNVTATDLCDGDVVPVLTSERVDGDCGYTINRTWTATDNCGNQAIRTQRVIVVVGIEANVSPSIQEVCVGYTTTYVASPAGPDYNYVWTVSGGGTISGDNETAVFTGGALGDYIIKVQISRKDTPECTGIAEAIVEVKNLARTSVSNNGPVCPGTLLQLEAGGGTSYSWTGPNNFTSTSKTPSIDNVTSAAAGRYTVVITEGQCSETLTTDVVLNQSSVITIQNNSPVCEGETAVLVASGSESYVWSDANDNVVGVGATLTLNNISSAQSGTYKVLGSDANNCIVEAETTVTITDKPADITTRASICAGESYVWSANGTTYTAAGTYTVTGSECNADQILVLTVTDKPADITTTASICTGESYVWSANGTTYTAAGTYTVTGSECNADQVLVLTITDKPADITTTASICTGESYVWSANGRTYTAAGEYTVAGSGCNADQILVLTISDKPADITTTASICTGESYVWSANGTTYTAAGEYTVAGSGCNADQELVLTITDKPADITTTASICTGESYVWSANGRTYTAAGEYTVAGSGCNADQILVLTISDKPADITTTASICTGESYVWSANGRTYTAAGEYTVAGSGCNADQILVLTITDKQADITTTASICTGESYVWSANGTIYTAAGEYTVAGSGCNADQILVLTITDKQADITTTASICTGESYVWSANGRTYTAAGEYTVAGSGCNADQILVLTITDKQADITTRASICTGESYVWSANGTAYTAAGEYTVAGSGCNADQVLVLTITDKPADITTTASICAGGSYVWSANGTIYTAAGEYTVAGSGCNADQVLVLTITDKPADITTRASICTGESYVWSANGTTYTAAGEYTVTVSGCNPNQVLVLTITDKPADIVINDTFCEGESYTWGANGTTYTVAGTYRVAGSGCNADRVLVLTSATKADPIITRATFCVTDGYVWSVNGTTYTAAGRYTEFGSGCRADQVLILTATDKPEDNVLTATFCRGEGYTWSENGTLYTEAGTYRVNNTGCIADRVLILTEQNCNQECILAVVEDIIVTDAECGSEQGSATIQITADPRDYVFSWSPNLGVANAMGNERVGLPAGTYEVIITNPGAMNCFIKTTVTIGNVEGPSVDDITINTTSATCGLNNGTANLGPADLVFSWPDGNMTASRSDLAAGDYIVNAIDPSVPNCPVAITVTVDGSNAAITATENVTNGDCDNLGAINLSVSGGSNYTFDWAHIAGSDNPRDLVDLQSGNYTVVITNGSGCTTILTNIPVFVGCDPCTIGTEVSVETTAENCGTRGSARFTPSRFTYTWLNDNIQAGFRDGLRAGIYMVEARDPASDCAVTIEVTIDEVEPKGATVTIDPVINLTCANQNAATVAFDVDYEEGFAQPAIISIVSAANGQEIPNGSLRAGDYCIYVQDANGCQAAKQCFMLMDPAPVVATHEVMQATCTNDGVIDLFITSGTAPYTFNWSDGESTEDRTDLNAGRYSVTITDANSCEMIISNIIVGADCDPCADGDGPSVTASTTEASCASDGGITLTVPADANYTYNWSDITGANDPQDRTGLAGGDYTVTVTDVNGCATVRTITVLTTCDPCADGDGPSVTASTTEASCASDGGITLTVPADANYTYNWSDIAGANDPQDRSGLAGGDYIVTVTDVNGCAIVRTITVLTTCDPCAGGDGPSVDESVIDAGCADDGIIRLTVPEGANYTYDWSDIAGSNDPQDRTGLPVGDYVVTVTDANRCAIVVEVTVMTSCPDCISGPSFTTTKTDVTCDANGSITLTLDDGSDASGYDWVDLPGTDNELNRTNLAPGDYRLIAQSNSKCSTILNFSILDTCVPGECEIFTEDTITVNTRDCMNGTQVCLGVNVDDLSNLELMINDQPYQAGVTACELAEKRFYDFSNLMNANPEGPYELVSWTFNDQVVTSRSFATIGEIAAFIIDTDSTSNWVYYPEDLRIEGGSTEYDFSTIALIHTESQASHDIDFNIISVPTSIDVNLPVGVHEVVLVDSANNCEESMIVTVECLENQRTVLITITPGVDTTYCLNPDNFNLGGAIDDITVGCEDDTNQSVDFTLDMDNACIDITGNIIGENDICLMVCDADGVCDSLLLVVDVVDMNGNTSLPIAVDNDTLTTIDQEVLIRVMDNDRINGVLVNSGIVSNPLNGTVMEIAGVGYEYTPNLGFCGESDSFQYFIENANGADTATVNVSVSCEELIVFSGFSPNGDGINDKFEVTGIENYPNNTVCIFNRWGNQVLFEKGYTNEGAWDGTWDTGNLPDGTYFYTIDLGDGSPMKSGYVQLHR